MRRIPLTAAALGLGLVLTACGADADETTTGAGAGATQTAGDEAAGDEAAASTGTDDATQAPMDDAACAGFFQTGPVTLAERAEADRTMLEAGEVGDPASWGEVNLLSQRITDLVEEGGDHAALLERVNAPFVEASDAVLDSDEQLPTDPEITVPEIDVTDSAAAQAELEAACTS